jgi:hypothetical protein
VSWVDLPYARQMWPDAPSVDVTLQRYLDASHGQVSEYAPAPLLDEDDVEIIPENWKLAEVLQARELWTATRRDGDVLGFDDGSAVRVRPLSSTAKALLRPPTPSRGLVG